ncbi:damage-inducible protein DinB [Lacibacter luteus]|uniref:Damage-inducible protein DinB n=1 Tax=Lacibacter luteus TaxID=2508719 RepID=A0A4Q1CL01_9BACT|nr:DinB family protein [Lacibacter luteus]RXK60962.1 damage-inducible protein DinB [Lacibacter luteus]
MKKQLITLLTILFVLTNANAQLADSIKASYIKDWERSKAYTKEYLDAMPKDKYDFRAQDSIRTFAQQMLHLSQGIIGFIANGTGAQRISFGQNIEQRKGAQSADSVMYYVMASYDYAIENIKNMDVTKLLEPAGRGNFMFSRLVWLNKALEHQAHHRGQTTIYIRLVGIKPPNERLF